jgi:hypothetical protein
MRTDCYEYQSGGLDGMDGLDVTEQVNHFRSYLKAGWPSVDSLMECHDWENDVGLLGEWIQASWELLVERELLPEDQYLTPLAPVMCYNTSRVIKKKVKPTFMIAAIFSDKVSNLEGDKEIPIDKPLRLFGINSGCRGGGLSLCPTFDVACLVADHISAGKMGGIFHVPIQEVKFILKKWPFPEFKN